MFNWTAVMLHQEHLKDIRREIAHDQLAVRAGGKPARPGAGLLAWAVYLVLVGAHSIGKALHV